MFKRLTTKMNIKGLIHTFTKLDGRDKVAVGLCGVVIFTNFALTYEIFRIGRVDTKIRVDELKR